MAVYSRVFLALFLFGAACSGDTESFTFVDAEEVGADPFVGDVAAPVSTEFLEIKGQLQDAADDAEAELDEVGSGRDESTRANQARQAAVVRLAAGAGLDVIDPGAPAGVGLYGGTGENICDVTTMVSFFSENPGIAQAFSMVQGIPVEDISTYLQGLRAGYLLNDHRVVNHGFRGGQAEPFNAELEAGTAVLVDDESIPRVRCKCGNPLIPVPVFDSLVAQFATVTITSSNGEIDFQNLGFTVVSDGTPLFLNQANLTVTEGPASEGDWNNTTSLQNVVDAPSAEATEVHTQETHVWFTGSSLELVFDFQQEYRVEAIHFWNFDDESWDADRVNVVFSDAEGQAAGEITFNPVLGTDPSSAETVAVPD